jgi:hypothetical protein
MKYLFIMSALCYVGSLYAQDALPPLPEGELLKRTPDNCVWSVTTQGTLAIDEAKAYKKQVSKDNKTTVSRYSKITKTGSTILEQNVDQQGRAEDVWHVDGLRLTKTSSGILILHGSGGGDIYSINFNSEDFAGLGWISAQTYAGIKKYSERDCIVFMGKVSPLSNRDRADEESIIENLRAQGESVSEAKQIDALAYIDLETRLPLYAEFGPEKRFYQYGGAPATPLSLPNEYAAALNRYAAQLKAVRASAGKP